MELQGASIMHHAVWNGVRAGLLWRLSRFAVPESERRSNTAPRESQGGCGKRRAFHAAWLSTIFTTLEQVLLMAMKQPYVTRAMFLGQKRISCGELNPVLARYFCGINRVLES